jgi:hypothetical protein
MDADLSQETVLVLYLDARIAMAEAELAQTEGWHRSNPSSYTAGKAIWAGHQLAALRIARRDAERPGPIIARYLSVRNKDQGKS